MEADEGHGWQIERRSDYLPAPETWHLKPETVSPQRRLEMKKLMTACAACMIAGLVSAAVESQNVVGYQTVGTVVGFTAVSPSFITVGGTQQITLDDVQGEFADGDSLQFFDAGGDVATEVFYLTEELWGLPTGWYADDFMTPVGSSTVPAGAAFWVSSQNGGSVLLSGEVNTDDVVVNAGVGFTPTGNCMPVDIVLSTIVFDGIADGDSLQFFDEGGDVETEVFYLTEELWGVPTGWYADDFMTAAGDTVVAAAQGFWISSQGGGVQMTISSAL